MKLVQTITLSATTASFQFINIPQSGTDLVILLSARTTNVATAGQPIQVRLNSISGGFYSLNRVSSNGLSAAVNSEGDDITSFTAMVQSASTAHDSGVFTNDHLYIYNYVNPNETMRSISVEAGFSSNSNGSNLRFITGRLETTQSINSVLFAAPTGNFAIGTTASLYVIE